MENIRLIYNKEEVTHIKMKPTACVKCQIGQDWYQSIFEVDFFPDKYYPDYMEICQFIREEIDGKELNIEEAAKLLLDFLRKYEPSYVSVINHVTDCKTHFDVDVEVGG